MRLNIWGLAVVLRIPSGHDILAKPMNTTKGPKGLREEWSLLLHSFLNEDPHQQTEKQKLVEKMKSAELTLDEIKIIKKELSSKRKKMNQSIEKIKIKIDQVNNVIENLRLVGSDSTGLVKEIDFLSHEGEKISEEVMDLDQKIKKLHELQDMVSA